MFPVLLLLPMGPWAYTSADTHLSPVKTFAQSEPDIANAPLCQEDNSDAGQQHQQLPKRQAEQQEGKDHESDANGLETKALSDGRN